MTEPEAHDPKERRPDEGYEAPTSRYSGRSLSSPRRSRGASTSSEDSIHPTEGDAMTTPEVHDPTETQPVEGYEAPSLEVLGSVAKLTQLIQSSIEQ